jgi:hypothetical protein
VLQIPLFLFCRIAFKIVFVFNLYKILHYLLVFIHSWVQLLKSDTKTKEGNSRKQLRLRFHKVFVTRFSLPVSLLLLCSPFYFPSHCILRLSYCVIWVKGILLILTCLNLLFSSTTYSRVVTLFRIPATQVLDRSKGDLNSSLSLFCSDHWILGNSFAIRKVCLTWIEMKWRWASN